MQFVSATTRSPNHAPQDVSPHLDVVIAYRDAVHVSCERGSRVAMTGAGGPWRGWMDALPQ